MNDEARRLASVVVPLAELEELIESVCYVLDRFDALTQLARSSRNLIVATVREHSRKPDEIYELVEATWPGPYVELFARYPRSGGSRWPEPMAEGES